MVKSFQDKLIERISFIAEEKGFEVVQQKRYANTGKLLVQEKNTFDSLVEITYDFQADTVSLTMSANGKPIVMERQKHRTDGYVKWYINITSGGEINEFVNKFQRALVKHA